MPRQHLPFDPNHSRCIYPDFGRHFDKVMAASGKSAAEIAKAVSIAAENIYGYRRGFSHPSSQTQDKLEKVLGVSLNPNGASVKPQALSLPGVITIQRDPAGELRFSFLLPPAELAKFLSA